MDEIRAYRPDDESACLDIFDSNRPKYFTGPERDLFAAYLKRLDEPFFVAEIAGQIRGCGGFHVDDYGVGYLAWGMVHSHWHRRGVGTNLLRWRLDRIREIAHAWCVLIDTSQHTAPFFARFGFEKLRVIADGYQPGLDKVFMRLVWAPQHASCWKEDHLAPPEALAELGALGATARTHETLLIAHSHGRDSLPGFGLLMAHFV